jgi:hypothetical protein
MTIEGRLVQVMLEITESIRQEPEKLANQHSWYENEERMHRRV